MITKLLVVHLVSGFVLSNYWKSGWQTKILWSLFEYVLLIQNSNPFFLSSHVILALEKYAQERTHPARISYRSQVFPANRF